VTIEGISAFSGEALKIAVEGSKIIEVERTGAGRQLPFVSPGFFDLQVNGYRGLDYSAPDLDAGAVTGIIEALAASGTTQHLPTIITNPKERIVRNLRVIAALRRQSSDAAAAMPGMHIEGPFISAEEGPRGAHSVRFVRSPDLDEFEAWQEAADGAIRIVTLAPELPGALAFIEQIAKRGVVAAIGHTAASPEQIRDAVSAGATLSTHLGNGSHAMLPRLKNYLWEQLAADGLAASLISDGFHLPPAVIKAFSRAKGLDRIVLVSDVAVHGGRAPGQYTWGELPVEVHADGHLGIPGTEFLAGAGHLLDWDLAKFIEATGCELGDAVRLCTTSPARLLGMTGADFPTAGAEANIVLFDFVRGSERLRVRRAVRAGGEVPIAPAAQASETLLSRKDPQQ